MRQLAAALAAIALLASTAADADTFRIASDPGTIVFEYGIDQPDPLPLIRIYGDGTVWVHHPAGTQRAGDYELRLERKQVRSLIASLAADGLLDVHESRLAGTAGKPDTIVRIVLERYKRKRNFDHELTWSGEARNARPAMREALDRLQARLAPLIDSPDLRRLMELPLAQR